MSEATLRGRATPFVCRAQCPWLLPHSTNTSIFERIPLEEVLAQQRERALRPTLMATWDLQGPRPSCAVPRSLRAHPGPWGLARATS